MGEFWPENCVGIAQLRGRSQLLITPAALRLLPPLAERYYICPSGDGSLVFTPEPEPVALSDWLASEV